LGWQPKVQVCVYRWEDAVQIRTCPYLNNVVEQDHRRIKARARCLSLSASSNARRVLAGIELVHKIIKGQFGLPESLGTDPLHIWYNALAA
jgi:transposase-like protein